MPEPLLIHKETTYIAPLSKSILKEYTKLVDALLSVPAQGRIDFTGGKVSVMDIVAYQIGWGKLLISWYETGLHGEVAEMPGDGFTTWDYTGLARHFYSAYHFESFDKQLKVFHDVVQKILSIVEAEHKTGNLDKTGVWPWCALASGKEWPLSKWITVNTSSPYKRASSLIRRFLKSGET